MKTQTLLTFLLLLFSCGIALAQPTIGVWTSPAPLDGQAKTVFAQTDIIKDDMKFTPTLSSKRLSGDGYEFRYEGRIQSRTYPIYGGHGVLTVTAPLSMRSVETEIARSTVKKPVSERSAASRPASVTPGTVPEKLKPRQITFRRL